MCLYKIWCQHEFRVTYHLHKVYILLKSDFHLPKNNCYLLHWKPFKDHEECFLFHFKSSFCSQDIYDFVMNFWSCRKKRLIRKIRLTSKFMTSQPGSQTITIHILPNISRSKGNQKGKLGQLMEYNKINIFLQKLCRKWGRETNSIFFYFFRKLNMR